MSYIKDTQKRAKNRLRSLWTIPLIMFCFILMILFWYGLYVFVMKINILFHPSQPYEEFNKSFRALCVVLPLLFAVIVPALITGNFVAWQIPPIRRSLNTVGKFGKSQRELWQFGRWLILFSILFSLISAVM